MELNLLMCTKYQTSLITEHHKHVEEIKSLSHLEDNLNFHDLYAVKQ
jgi:hypothetical protein